MTFGRPLITFDRVSSTMDVAASLAKSGAKEGACIVAGEQLAGRGRASRHWETPPGSALLCSVILRPQFELSALTPMSILVADAITGAAGQVCGVNAGIKWPNDVLVGGRKLSGVLIQSLNVDRGLVMIVGFGINANIPSPQLPAGATSLCVVSGQEVALDELRNAVLQEIERRYTALQEGDLRQFWPGIERRLAMKDDYVSILEGPERITGRLTGLASDGALLLDVGGRTRRIISGDLVRGPRTIANT